MEQNKIEPHVSGTERTPEKPIHFAAKAAVILLLTFAAYLPAINSDFIWDDALMVSENPLLENTAGLKAIWFSTKPYDYFPLTLSSFWLERRLWGLNPTGYNIVNIFLHAMGAILFWRVLKRLRIPGAFVAGLVFALHPVCVASVAWISERKNTLSLVFFLLSILFWLRSTGPHSQAAQYRREAPWRVLSFGAFLCALLSKTSVVMLPVVLLGIAWWQNGAVRKRDLLRTLPFFAASLVLGIVTVWFQFHRASGGEPVDASNFAARFAGAGWAVWFYLYKALWPVNLSMIYPKWTIDSAAIVSYAPGLLLIGLLWFLWARRNTWSRHALFAMGYFTVMLFPVMGFFDMYYFNYSRVADHWQYLPILGIIAGGAAAGVSVAARLRWSGLASKFAVGGLVLPLFCLTWQQSKVYQDRETLWRHTLQKNPAAWVARHGLAAELKEQGKIEEAMQEYHAVLEVRPHSQRAHYNLGVLHERRRNFSEAIRHYRELLRINPHHARGRNNLGMLKGRLGDYDAALEHLQHAIDLDPENAEAHNNLANVFQSQGDIEAAVTHYGRALELKPESFEAHNNLGVALEIAGDAKRAEKHYLSAIAINGDYLEAQFNLGNLLFKRGRFAEAEKAYRTVLRLNPRLASAHYNLGLALVKQGKRSQARECFKEALRQKPDFAEVERELRLMAGADDEC